MKKIIAENFHLILMFILVTISGYWYISSLNGLKNISKRQKFTVALIISDWHHKDANGVGVDYEYIVNDRKFLIFIIKIGMEQVQTSFIM